jgi:SpoVK/Ycf46/Vps4 family AAA+-type ATPase
MKFINTPKGITSTVEEQLQERVPSGSYRLSYDSRQEKLYYIPTKLEYDKLVDLPSVEYDSILKEMSQFLKPETKKAYEDHGFIYKRSVFLHGGPGTGKSCIVNRVCEKVVSMGGIVIFNDYAQVTMIALEELKNLNPNVLTLVIFEEFDEVIENDEENMLRLLDGQVQKNNAVYLATTNFLNKIPKRMLRPGRFSRVIEVFPPSIEARLKYIETVSRNKTIVKELAEKTAGFTIDELKESVLSINCLGYKLDEAVDRIKQTSDVTSRLKDNVDQEDPDLDQEEL